MAELVVRTPETFREKYDIDVRTRHEVVGIDLDRRQVQVERLEDGKSWWEPFDQLLIATGAGPLRPNLPGIDAPGVHAIGSLQSGIRLRRAIDEEQPRRAVIVGGGYIGLEMAEGLLLRGIDVSLVEMAPQVMRTLDPDMAALVAEALQAEGVDLYLEESVAGFEVQGGRVGAVTTDKRTLPADIVVLGMGVRPNSGLAGEAGVPLGVKGAIRVNELMQTEVEGVWAAGDCVESFHLVSRRPFYVALATVANKQGKVAGINLGGGYRTFAGVLGTAVTKFCDLEVARTGLQEREVEGLGWAYVEATIESYTRAHYYPGTERITVKVLADKGSGRLLGGQIVGGRGSAKRIDILATALYAGLTVDEIVHLDLGYAPPFSQTWDPVHIAARQAVKRL